MVRNPIENKRPLAPQTPHPIPPLKGEGEGEKEREVWGVIDRDRSDQ